MSEDILVHYGVLGMKWGLRKDRRGRNPNYSDQQRKRDTQVYGKRGAKRINKKMNKGDQVSVARGDEKTRRDRVMGKNKYVRQVGKVGGTVLGGAIGYAVVSGLPKLSSSFKARAFLSKNIGAKATSAIFDGTTKLANLVSDPMVKASVTAGSAAVGNMLSGDIAVNARMRAHGYDPNRR